MTVVRRQAPLAVLPQAKETYDRRDEAEFRAMILKTIQDLALRTDGYASGTASLSLDIDNDVIVSISARDDDTDSAYFTLNNTAFDEPTTSDTEILRTAMPYSADQGLVLASGETGYFWLKFYNNQQGFGQEIKLTITPSSGLGNDIPASLVIESETEIIISGEEVTASEDAYVGSVASFTNDTWANLQGGVNTALNFSRTDTYLEVWLSRDSSGTATEWSRIYRSMVAFPTTSIDSEAVATESSFVRLKCALNPQETITGQKVVLVKATPASASTMAHTDWGNITGSVVYSAAVTLASFESGDNVTFTLNTAGAEALTAAIAAQTPFVVGVLIESDAGNAEPTITSPSTEVNARTRFHSVNHGTAANRPVISISADIPKAQVGLRMSDPDAVVTSVEYRTKVGETAWPGTWSELVTGTAVRANVTPEADGTYVMTDDYPITLNVVEKPLSWAQARLKATVDGEVLYSSPITSSGFDLGKIPNIAAQAVIDVNWYASLQVQGDFDTGSIKVAFNTGGNPTQPDKTQIRAVDALDGRTFSPDDLNGFYESPTDIPVLLGEGEKVIFGILGYSAASGGGKESTNAVYVTAERPVTTSTVATLGVITASAAENGSNIEWTVAWPNAANLVDATHLVRVTVTLPEYEDIAPTDDEETPESPTSIVVTASGYGTGGGNEGELDALRWKAVAELIDDTSGEVVLSSSTVWGRGYTV